MLTLLYIVEHIFNVPTDRVVEEILKRMWDNFEPEENVQKMMELEKKAQKLMRKSNKWKPIVTVPKPFNMTVREERKLKDNLKLVI